MMDRERVRRWRFMLSDWDDLAVYVDAEGGPDGDAPVAEFVGNLMQAQTEGDRRAEMWEQRTGVSVARVTCESQASCG